METPRGSWISQVLHLALDSLVWNHCLYYHTGMEVRLNWQLELWEEGGPPGGLSADLP